MSPINAVLRALFDALLYPFRGLHPLVGLSVVSLVIAIGMLYVFKWTSNQKALEAVKRRIHASLFEIRLFNDDFRAIMRAQFDILRHNLRYVGLSLVPLLWMMIPLVLIIAQLQFHYGYQGLELGEPVLLKVELEQKGQAARPQIELQAPAGIKVEAGPVWIPAEGELAWRIAAEQKGDYELSFALDGQTYTKTVRVRDDVVRRSTLRPGKSFFDQLLYPAEAPLPSGAPIRAIELAYPPGDAGITGWDNELTWMGVFFVLSLVFAFALRGPLGVTI